MPKCRSADPLHDDLLLCLLPFMDGLDKALVGLLWLLYGKPLALSLCLWWLWPLGYSLKQIKMLYMNAPNYT